MSDSEIYNDFLHLVSDRSVILQQTFLKKIMDGGRKKKSENLATLYLKRNVSTFGSIFAEMFVAMFDSASIVIHFF